MAKTKKEIIDELKVLRNTAIVDLDVYENQLIDNEIYDPTTDDMVALSREARIVLLEAIRDTKHVLRRLNELLNS